MEFLNGYIKSIASFLIFSAFVGMILPGEKYKNYINLILGLILILNILKPLAGKNDWSLIIPNGLPEFEAVAEQAELSDYEEVREQLISELYKSRLSDQIVALIESETDWRVLEADAEVRSDTGEPLQITLLLSSEEREHQPSSFIRIEEVNLTDGNHDEAEAAITGKEEENIKKIVSDFYNLSVDNIHIRVQRKKQG